MEEKVPYFLTVFFAVWLIVIGYRFAAEKRVIVQDGSQEVVRAEVQRVIERIKPEVEIDEFFPASDTVLFEAKISSGKRKGEILIAAQTIGGASLIPQKEVAKGDKILLIGFYNDWYYNGNYRIDKLIGLGSLFALSVIFLGRKKGFNTILSLALTCAAVFAVLVPAIGSGKNAYLWSSIVCAYVIIMTLLIVVGFNKKAFTAAAGCGAGVLMAGIITLIMDRLLLLTGFVDEQSRYLATLPGSVQINLRAIVFAGIIVGAMGAVMDVAMSISSSMWEIKEQAKSIKFSGLLRSGLNIGRDIMGTMANTLVLAYMGCSLSVVLVLSVYSNSLLGLFNSEMIVVEILQALAGSFGILLTIPLTALFCSVVYLKE